MSGLVKPYFLILRLQPTVCYQVEYLHGFVGVGANARRLLAGRVFLIATVYLACHRLMPNTRSQNYRSINPAMIY